MDAKATWTTGSNGHDRGMEESVALAVARLAIAVVQEDERVSPEASECIQDLIYQLSSLTAESFQNLETLMAKPLFSEQRESIFREFGEQVKTPEERAFALYVIKQLVGGDGVAGEKQQALSAAVEEALDVGDVGRLEGVMRGPFSQRVAELREQPAYCRDVLRFLEHNVHSTAARQELHIASWRLTPEEEERLGLTGALIARLPLGEVEDETLRKNIVRSLHARLELDFPLASYAAIAATTPGAKQLDFLRLVRRLFHITTEAQRIALLYVLVDVAECVERPGIGQLDAIMNIAANIRVGQDAFSPVLEYIEERWGPRVLEELYAAG